MSIHVLLINRQLVFAVTIKQALEQTGAFEVHPFTTADPAIEYLRTHPHEVALVDFTLPDGPRIVQRLRALQPEIAVIVSPTQPNASNLMRDLRLQAIVDAPFSARSIIPLIEHAVEQITQPYAAITRNLPGSDEGSSGETELLPGDKSSTSEPDVPASALPRKKPIEPLKPRVLETRHFEQPEPPKRPSPPPVGATRIFDDSQLPPGSPQTRSLTEDAPKIKPLSGQTRPPNLPEFSSLDEVLSDEAPSEMFDVEPPVGDGDTPSVPVVDSDAVRQFLATKPPTGDDTFGAMLGTIDPNKDPRPRGNTFDDLVNSMRNEQQHTALPDRHQQFIEFILTGGMEHLLTEIEKNKPASDDESPEPSVSEKLAQEEPPMPTLEESGTVGDLMLGVSDTSFRNVLAMMSGDETVEESDSLTPRLSKEMEEAFAAFFEQQTTSTEAEPPFFEERRQPIPIPPPQRDESAIPARLILETAQDDSALQESFSLNSLIVSIERQLSEHTPDVQPLPSWGKEVKLKLEQRRQVDDRYIKEPDFLPEEFSTSQMVPVTTPDEPAVPAFVPDSLPEQEALLNAERPPVTMPEWDDIAQWDVNDVDSEALEAEFEIQDDWADVTVLGEPAPDWDEDIPLLAVEPERPALDHDFFFQVDESPDEPTVMLPRTDDDWVLPASNEEAAPMEFFAASEDPAASEYDQEQAYIAQIALSLTQVSLELTADATLLARDGELIATAGSLSRDDIEEFRLVIGDEWESKGDDARIRFIRLPSSSRDYMLYSRKTAGDFTLSMIFSTNTPLRDIRRQGKRLLEALETVPEEIAPPEPATLPEMEASVAPASLPAGAQSQAETLSPFAYVWLSNAPLADTSTRTIQTGLRVQLRELGWNVSKIEAQGEYVYVLADVPGEQPAYEVVRDLKRRAAAAVHMQHPEAAITWTDGYLVMTPGRPLEAEEIEQFIRFERLQ